MPVLSVLTAAFAPTARYVDAAGASVRDQALPDGWDLEWIVQEDGPNPALSDRIRRVGCARYAANNTQLGIAATRNLALFRATGALIHVLDQDDLLLPGALATLVSAFVEHRIHWAVGAADDLMPDGTRKSWESALPFGVVPAGTVNAVAAADGANWPVHCAGLMMRTATVRALGGWAGLPTDDDVTMFAALSELADGYNESEVIWLYRQHAHQTSRSQPWRSHSADTRRIALQRAASIRATGTRLAPVSSMDFDQAGVDGIEVGPPAKEHQGISHPSRSAEPR